MNRESILIGWPASGEIFANLLFGMMIGLPTSLFLRHGQRRDQLGNGLVKTLRLLLPWHERRLA